MCRSISPSEGLTFACQMSSGAYLGAEGVSWFLDLRRIAALGKIYSHHLGYQPPGSTERDSNREVEPVEDMLSPCSLKFESAE